MLSMPIVLRPLSSEWPSALATLESEAPPKIREPSSGLVLSAMTGAPMAAAFTRPRRLMRRLRMLSNGSLPLRFGAGASMESLLMYGCFLPSCVAAVGPPQSPHAITMEAIRCTRREGLTAAEQPLNGRLPFGERRLTRLGPRGSGPACRSGAPDGRPAMVRCRTVRARPCRGAGACRSLRPCTRRPRMSPRR